MPRKLPDGQNREKKHTRQKQPAGEPQPGYAPRLPADAGAEHSGHRFQEPDTKKRRSQRAEAGGKQYTGKNGCGKQHPRCAARPGKGRRVGGPCQNRGAPIRQKKAAKSAGKESQHKKYAAQIAGSSDISRTERGVQNACLPIGAISCGRNGTQSQFMPKILFLPTFISLCLILYSKIPQISILF